MYDHAMVERAEHEKRSRALWSIRQLARNWKDLRSSLNFVEDLEAAERIECGDPCES